MNTSAQDVLVEGPVSAVLRARIALAEEKYERAIQQIAGFEERFAAIKRENEALRAQIAGGPTNGLGAATARVLVHLFKAEARDERGVGAMVKALTMERNALQYHLDRLHGAGLVEVVSGNGPVHWALTAEGRRHVMEAGLL
jgi:hypothetical protein